MWTLSMHAAQLAVSSRAPACCVASGAEDPWVEKQPGFLPGFLPCT
jgi:hypothetical protein